MKPIFLTIIVFSLAACQKDQNLERRVNALERRVAELEQQISSSPQASPAKLTSQPGVTSDTGPKSGTALKPVFHFEEPDYNFGTINEGEVVNHLYKFTNVGAAPLIITKATASCGCTVPSPPKDPILPGQSSEIRVQFDTKNKPNQQVKTITIEANTDPVITKLQLRGFVVPKNQSNPGN
jgi:hypothetical protein